MLPFCNSVPLLSSATALVLLLLLAVPALRASLLALFGGASGGRCVAVARHAWRRVSSVPGAAGAVPAVMLLASVFFLSGLSGAATPPAGLKAYSWGDNGNGQLGTGNTTQSSVPVSVLSSPALNGKTVVQVAAGGAHSVALCADGTLVAWGRNDFGELGNNRTTNSSVPVAVASSGALNEKTVVQVAAGGNHSLALCDDGTVVAWGYNAFGQLGNNSTTDSSVPVAVSTTSPSALNGKTVVQVAAGFQHSVALCDDGTLVAWGDNSSGQLGTGNSTTQSEVPVAVVSTSSSALNGRKVVQVAAGQLHSLALCDDGTLVAWGRNFDGQLGMGSTTDSSVPVAVLTSGTSALKGQTVVQLMQGSVSNHTLVLAVPTPNTAPEITTAAIDKPNPTTNELLRATPSTVNMAGSSDGEGDTLTFSYVWKNGTTTLAETGPTLDLSTAGNGDRGDSITVTVTATETGTSPALSSQPVTSNPVIVQNSAPVVGSVNITPNKPAATSLLTATVVASDADNDAFTLSYQWQKNDENIVGATNSTLDLSKQSNIVAGDVIKVIVTATETDGTTPLSSQPVSNSVTVGNLLPSVVSVTPQNTTDAVGNKQTFTLAVSDPSGTGDISELWLLINTSLSWDGGATLLYVPKSGELYLRRGDAFGSPIKIGAAAGTGDVLDNGALRIVGSEVTVETSGNTMTLTLPATVRNGLVGQNTLFGRVQDVAGGVDAASLASDFGFVRFGPYTVKSQFAGSTNIVPTLSALSPKAAFTTILTTGVKQQTFVFYANDEDGTGDLDSLWFVAGKSRDWTGNATFVFLPRTRRLYLRSDDGQSFLGGGRIGTAGTIENSQVKVDLAQVQYLIYADGKSVGLRLTLQPKAGLLGQNQIWLRVQDNSGATSTGGDNLGFVQSGTWNVGRQSTTAGEAPSVPGS